MSKVIDVYKLYYLLFKGFSGAFGGHYEGTSYLSFPQERSHGPKFEKI